MVVHDLLIGKIVIIIIIELFMKSPVGRMHPIFSQMCVEVGEMFDALVWVKYDM